MARTAVVAGTAQTVAGRVARHQAAGDQVAGDQVAGQDAPAVPAPARPPGLERLSSELTQLGELRQAGLLTDEEFAAQKARLLAAT